MLEKDRPVAGLFLFVRSLSYSQMPRRTRLMEDLHWIGLKAIPGIGNVTFRRLLERFETPEAALSAPPAALSSVRGVTPAILEAITHGSWRGFAEAECLRLAASGARLVTFTSADYPKSLFEIPDPPPFLYVRGELRCHETCRCHCRFAPGHRLWAPGNSATGRGAGRAWGYRDFGHGPWRRHGRTQGGAGCRRQDYRCTGLRYRQDLSPRKPEDFSRRWPKKAAWFPNFPWAPCRWPRTSPAATGSSAAFPAACWWWRRPRTAAR